MSGGEIEIVIVEDNPNDAELIRRVLAKCGAGDKSILLKDGAEALDFMFGQGAHAGRSIGQGPKVILLDLKLPKVDGIEVLRRLKSDERTRKVPVVALTSSFEPQDLKAAYELGVNSYVTKPIESRKFAEIMGKLGMYWLELNKTPSK